MYFKSNIQKQTTNLFCLFMEWFERMSKCDECKRDYFEKKQIVLLYMSCYYPIFGQDNGLRNTINVYLEL